MVHHQLKSYIFLKVVSHVMPTFNLQLKGRCLVHNHSGQLGEQVTQRERGEGETGPLWLPVHSRRQAPPHWHSPFSGCLSCVADEVPQPMSSKSCVLMNLTSHSKTECKVSPFMLRGATPSRSTSVLDPEEEDTGGRGEGGKRPLTARYLRASRQDSFYASSQLLFIM